MSHSNIASSKHDQVLRFARNLRSFVFWSGLPVVALCAACSSGDEPQTDPVSGCRAYCARLAACDKTTPTDCAEACDERLSQAGALAADDCAARLACAETTRTPFEGCSHAALSSAELSGTAMAYCHLLGQRAAECSASSAPEVETECLRSIAPFSRSYVKKLHGCLGYECSGLGSCFAVHAFDGASPQPPRALLWPREPHSISR